MVGYNKKLKLGDEIDAYCVRCRLNLNCAVAAIVGEKVVQVQCKTCLSVQKYHPPVDEKEKKEKLLKRVLKMKEKKEEKYVPKVEPEKWKSRWQMITENVDARYAKVYDKTRKYSEGDFILHKSYGLGMVEFMKPDKTLIVLFRDGYKELESEKFEE